jgi:nitrate reductase gamma subunit
LELDEGTATAIGLAIGLLIIAGLVALWLRSCRMHQNRTSQAAAGGSTNSGQPGFRSRFSP